MPYKHFVNLFVNKNDLRCLSIAANKIFTQNLKFDRLDVSEELAQEMFKYNKWAK